MSNMNLVLSNAPSSSGGGTYRLLSTYHIYSEAATYKAMDEDGNIDYSGSDAGSVINSAVGVGSKLITLGTGIFNCGTRITLKNNTTLKGAGIGATTLFLNNSTNDVFMINETAASGTLWNSYITLEDFTIDGNGANQAGATHIVSNNTSTIYFAGLQHLRMNRVQVCNGQDYNLRLGFSRTNNKYVRYATIENCIINKTYDETGGNCDLMGENVDYISCEAYDSARDGFDHNAQNITFINCRSHDNEHSGFYAEGRENNGEDESNGINYISCFAYANDLLGLCMDMVSEVNVLGGRYYENYDSGIEIKCSGSTSVLTHGISLIGVDVQNNNYDKVGTYSSNQYGIYIDRYVDDVKILGCNISDTQGSVTQVGGILCVTSHVGRVTISDCIISGHEDFGIYLGNPTSFCKISGNHFINTGIYACEIGSLGSYNHVFNNYFSGNTQGVYVNAGAAFNVIEENDFRNQATTPVNDAGSATIVRRNLGFVTENSGTAVILNGATNSGTVLHGLGTLPTVDKFNLVATNNLGSINKYHLGSVTVTGFVIIADTDPGGTATFGWNYGN